MTRDEKGERHLEAQWFKCCAPAHMAHGMIYYILYGIEPGGCMLAILANDLMEALGRADENTAMGLKEICTFIYSYAPRHCHGSYETTAVWMKHGGLYGATFSGKR